MPISENTKFRLDNVENTPIRERQNLLRESCFIDIIIKVLYFIFFFLGFGDIFEYIYIYFFFFQIDFM
jgi:hypothetical protein